MLRYLRSLLGGSPAKTTGLVRAAGAARPALRGRYDAAQTNDGNRKHWAFADSLSADAAANPDVRRILRNRARYEVANNSYAQGMVDTLAHDTIGTGPRLQMNLDEADAEVSSALEAEFAEWSKAIGLAQKLRTMRAARVDAGECFGVITFNPALPTRIKVDLKIVESEQVATPDRFNFNDRTVDGIDFDRFGNPLRYYILRSHPGSDTGSSGFGIEYDPLPAEDVIHYFRPRRPGQSRGVPDLTPALPLFAQLRRFTLATLAAAETAANFAGILYTDAPPDGATEDVAPMDAIELEARALLTAPAGWRMEQMKAEHPSTTYAEFKKELLNEIARCMQMPFNVAAGNSSGYNYASGRLDHQTYFKSLRVEQEHIGSGVLDRLLYAFLQEAVLISGLVPPRARRLIAGKTLPPHQWFFDGTEHVDPAKEATAQQTRLGSNTTTLAREYARQGLDWEPEIRQRAREIALLKELGITPEPAAPAPAPAQPEPDPEEVEQELEDAA